jgi:methanogenic corrinoid protein MtbC1
LIEFAIRLRELRGQHRLRQRDLADKLGLAQTTIANYEQGSRFPDEKTLYAMADYFRVSLDYLLGRSNVNLLPENLGYGTAFYSDRAEELPAMSALARRYMDTLLAGNREEASLLVLEAFEGGASIETLYLEVFERSLKEVGCLWSQNQLDVGTEHFFTASTQTVMSQLYPHLVAQARQRSGRSCLVFSVCGEFHEVGPRMVGDLLERAGWRCFFLGGNLCNEDIVKAAVEHRADLVAVSATMYLNVDSAARLIRTLRDEKSLRMIKILVGGRPFNMDPELWKRVGADGYARNAAEAPEVADRLVSRDRATVESDR